MRRRIHVVINPAAGQDRPILGVLNRVFHPAGVDWDVSITKEPGDAERLAQTAAREGADVVAVYGGDGTIMEVANGLLGTGVPMAIFPGGTANVMSVELGIPSDLAEACALASSAEPTIRTVDMGQIDHRHFLLRVGLGLEAEMVEGADRTLKDRLGVLAYGLSALQALKEPSPSTYRIVLDGQTVETEGITCIIANVGSLGYSRLAMVPTINASDGLLDLVVVRRADLPTLVALAAQVVAGAGPAEALSHWQAREIEVSADPPQPVQVDGEPTDLACVSARVVPGALKVIVPRTNCP